MSATRSRKEEKTYKQHLRSVDPGVCAFCPIKRGSDQFIEETANFKVITNIFAYSIWDGQRVISHLMLTPKKHTDNLGSMTTKQKVEYVDLVEKYENQGYNIYARAPSSAMKSIVHQHTHLIKTAGAPHRFILLLRKPYVRLPR